VPITLAQAQVNTQSDVDYAVIDNLRRHSWVLDQIVFDDTVTPGTNSASLTYSYRRLKTPRTAAFRALNSEYTPTQAVREPVSVDLKPHGGSFNIDRVLADLGPAATNETNFQLQELLTATDQKWLEELVNGDTAVDALGFDGLNKALTNTATEYDPLDNGVTAGYLDWTIATIDSQAKAMAQLDHIDQWLATIVPSKTGSGDLGADGALPPGVKAILGNTKSTTRLRALARWAGLYTLEQDALGRKIERYGPWVIHDMGDGQLGSSPIIKLYTADADEGGGGGNITNLTDLYGVSFGLDSLHAASPAGKQLVQTFLPDFSASGAVKTGEVEMGPSAVALKNSKSCGVLRKVKVQ
jgi:hypothetical protein